MVEVHKRHHATSNPVNQLREKKLNEEELDKVIKDSYKTLISLRNRLPNNTKDLLHQNASVETSVESKKENLKKKYAKFTKLLF